MLGIRFIVRCDDPALARWLGDLTLPPGPPWPIARTVECGIERADGGWWVRGVARAPVFYAEPDTIIAHLRHRFRDHVVFTLGFMPHLKAALIALAGVRTLIVSRQPERLADAVLTLWAAGADVEGPSVVLVTPRGVAALPERVRAPAGSTRARLRPYADARGGSVYHLPPRRRDAAPDGPPDAIVALEGGAADSFRAISKVDAVARCAAAVRSPGTDPGAALAALARLAGRAACYAGGGAPRTLAARLRAALVRPAARRRRRRRPR